MKLNITFSLIALLAISSLSAQGFGSNPTTWSIPPGGHTYSTISYGFDALAYSAVSNSPVGDQTWSVLDINGDGKPDLVIMAQSKEHPVFANQPTVFGTPASAYWKVHLNNGNGFAATSVNWPIPQGGHSYADVQYGFDALAHYAVSGSPVGDKSWSVVDMNGDGKPDLVVTAESKEYEQFSNQPTAYGTPGNMYWKVYLNSGSGFNSTPLSWPIPQGGHTYSTVVYGFDALGDSATSGSPIGDQSWSITDINGDNKPDLVVTAESRDAGNFSNQATAYGSVGSMYWKVYLNNGSGFAATATNWPIPQGGHSYSTIKYGFDALGHSAVTGSPIGDQTWSYIDMNNDNRPDLVVTAESKDGGNFADYPTAYGPVGSMYWKVFYNTGAGFNTTATNWPIPQGGNISSGTTYGFDALANIAPNGSPVGNQSWSIIDMNNDQRPDLVVTAQSKENVQFVNQVTAFGNPGSMYWKVFLNNGNGFNANAGNFPIPQGGHYYQSVVYGFDMLSDYYPGGELGNQTWSVIDMNNDHKPDLVVMAESVEFEQFSNQAIAFGSAGNRFWKVYMNTGQLQVEDFKSHKDGITVFPNPSNGIFQIEMPHSGAFVSLEVNDLAGRSILKTEGKTIDISAFPKGVYLLKINDGEQTYAKKIILK